jgi:hypothetical protein
MASFANRHAIVRKSMALFRQIPRTARRYSLQDLAGQPPILVNSFPKSGTHLLLQILQGLPNSKNYGTFIASMPSLTYRERSEKRHLSLIQRLVPGEVCPAHLFYSEPAANALAQKDCVHFFIFRDLRDVVVSEAHYLYSMNRWHRLHKYFGSLKTIEERISASISGINGPEFPYDYPDIGTRFERYKAWLSAEDVMAIKFEDLIAPQRTSWIRKMVLFWKERQALDEATVDDITNQLEIGIDPEQSHTFRTGKVGGWKTVFNDEHKTQFKTVAGALLIELGYEKNLDW